MLQNVCAALLPVYFNGITRIRVWRCGVTPSFGVFFQEMICNRMTSFMEFMFRESVSTVKCYVTLWLKSNREPFYYMVLNFHICSAKIYAYCRDFLFFLHEHGQYKSFKSNNNFKEK